MTNPDLQPGKPVQTRSGLEAVIWSVRDDQQRPIRGEYKDEYGEWITFSRFVNGSILIDGTPHVLGIIPKPKKLTGLINVYEGFAATYDTREEADKGASSNRIACLDLSEHNLTEGHGLTEGS